MPKWTIALIAAVFAGIVGLISGGLLARTHFKQVLTEQKNKIEEYDKQEKLKIAANEAKIKYEEEESKRKWVKKMEERVRTMLNEDGIHSINFEFKEVRIDPLVWSMATLEQKQGLVNFFSDYFISKGRTGSLTILSSRNDTKLATLSLWGGVKILQ